MPDAAGRFKGISTAGVRNAWLDSLERKPYLDVIDAYVDRVAEETGVPRVVLMNGYVDAHYPETPGASCAD